MKVTDLRIIKEPDEKWNVTQYYVVLDNLHQCITWWSAHYDDLNIGDDVELISEDGDMKWKVDNNMMVVKKVKLKPSVKSQSKSKMKSMSQSNPSNSISTNTEILKLALTHCHHMDTNDDYDIYRMYHFFMNIENQPGFEDRMDEDVKWQFIPESMVEEKNKERIHELLQMRRERELR